MRKLGSILLAFACAALLLSWADAQPPGGKKAAKDYGESSIVTKMMAYNTTKDGKLTKAQLTDQRLHRLFDLADTNKDGVVTRDELMALAAKLDEEFPQGGGFGGGPGGFGGDKGPKGKGGFGKGKGGFGKGPGGPPQPGQILAPFLQEMLQLTADQKQQLDTLQKDVDVRLGKILTDAQRQQLRELQERGPFGKGPPPPKQ
jgi:hypothetical protein